MASLNGVSSRNTVSSLMNSANMISGLASGLDTEGMIESLVKSYQTKISQLNQKVTKTEWKQEAYRSIISKMYNFSQKYTSYTSSTNLMSPSFFSSAVKVLTKGDFADSVTASGKTDSDIALNAVHQLAKGAQYRTKSNLAAVESGVISGAGVDLSMDGAKDIELSNLKGSLSLTYGTKTVSISFNESTDVEAMNDIRKKLAKDQGIDEKDVSNTEVMAGLINQKLADEKIVFNNGNSEAASDRIKATAGDDGAIRFTELKGNNGLYISGASGNVAKQLGLDEEALEDAKESKITEVKLSADLQSTEEGKGLTRKINSFEYIAERNGSFMNMSLDGTTKRIAMPRIGYEKKEVEEDDGSGNMVKKEKEIYYINGKEVAKDELAAKYTEALQQSVKDAFGDKVTVENKGTDGKLQLEFKVKNEGSDLIINTDIGDALGIGNTATSFLNTSKTLKDLMGDKLGGLTPVYETDDKGEVKKDENGNPIPKLDDKGKQQYDFTLNGVKIGTYTEDTKLSKILSDINSNKDAGVQVSYSQTTQNFTFKSRETGADSKIELGDGLAQAIFGAAGSNPDAGNFSKTYGVGLADGETRDITITVPGVSRGFTISASDSIEDVAENLNKRLKNFGYNASYNDLTGQLMVRDSSGKMVDFTLKDSKDGTEYEVDEEVFTSSYTSGQDALFTATINGEQKNMTRSSNSVNIDGLTINMEETFNSKKPSAMHSNFNFEVEDDKKSVTFQNKTDSDKIIDAIKGMVEDYNAMMSEIKSAYGTMPARNSSGAFGNYEPLTDEDREGMSESAIERYEEKAKQGILFGDRNLNNLYTKMNQAFSFANKADVDTLKDMGISIGFSISDGAQAITIDEGKLRSMLDSDPDRVAELFTKTDGVMDRMKKQLDTYGKTTGEPKGILVQQAGTPLSSLSLMNNNWQKQIDNYNKQIEKWQDKLTSQVEKYTSQFARLEQLIQQMNSQSSTLMGMMGGG